MMEVTVYTMPNCVQCEQSKRYLDTKQVEYSVVDISEDSEAYEFVTSLGYKSAPIIVAGNDHWSGFRLERLNGIVDRYNLEKVREA